MVNNAMKVIKKKSQQIIKFIKTKFYSVVGGQLGRLDNEYYSLSKLKENTKNNKELLVKVQNIMTDFFNDKISIDKETRYELVGFIEEYHRNSDNISMTMKALSIEDKSILNKN